MINKHRIIVGFVSLVLLLPSFAVITQTKAEIKLPNSTYLANGSRKLNKKNLNFTQIASNNITPVSSQVLGLLEQNLNSLCQSKGLVKTMTPNPDELTAVVDKFHLLPANYQPQDLVWIKDHQPPFKAYGRLRLVALPSLLQMLQDMKNSYLVVEVSSGFRNYSSQQRVYNSWVAKVGVEKAQYYAALPGESEHQLGTAVDINPVTTNDKKANNYRQTLVYNWLQENAFRYGFVQSYPKSMQAITGYNYEPWHYRFVGKEIAQSIREQNLTLSEYLYQINGICL